MRLVRRDPCAAAAVLGLLLAGCASSAEDGAYRTPEGAGMDAGSAAGYCYGANDCPPGYRCNEFHYCTPISGTDGGKGADGGLPEEVENQHDPPAAGKRYVYVAVPGQQMVAKIDSLTLQVRSVKVGKDPGALRTAKGQDLAVVLNRKSASASVLRSRADGGDDLETLKTVSGLNAQAISPDGKYAVAYFDVTRSGGELGTRPPLQDVTLLKLEAGKEAAVDLTVGYKPSGVQFTSDSARAFVISEKDVSIIEPAKVTGPGIATTVPLLKAPLTEAKPSEVLVTPDGKLALLRQKGVKGIRAVDLASRAITDVTLQGEPTDLDLTSDGKLAVAVLRDAGLVALLDIPGDLAPGAQIDTLSTGTYTAGQAVLSQDGKHAFLFTNATSQEVLLRADLSARTLSVHGLEKGVRTVVGSPDGKTVLVVHNKAPGTPSKQDGLETYVDKSYGYSLLSLAASFTKLHLCGADPGPVVFAPDSLSAYLTLSDRTQGLRSVESIDVKTFGSTSIALGSAPVSLGVLASTRRVYVAQDHPLGRVTFIDMGSSATRTVTGFVLNGQIIE
jgi:DNA-binding beta-propeller fold protein YncE